MINSRKLDDLLPQVRNRAKAFLDAAKAQGIDLLVTSTYRDFEQQDATYAQGRTTPGSVVTCAKAGKSWHNWKRAFDVVPLVNGKPVWNDLVLWDRIGKIGEANGLEWAGRWVHFRELPHFQMTEGLSLDGLLAAHPKGLS